MRRDKQMQQKLTANTQEAADSTAATQCGASSARGVSNTSKRGGIGSARADEHGGSERRGRQLSRKVVGVGIGVDSPEDIWGREDIVESALLMFWFWRFVSKKRPEAF